MQPDSGRSLPIPTSCTHGGPSSHPITVHPKAGGPVLKVSIPPVQNFTPQINYGLG